MTAATLKERFPAAIGFKTSEAPVPSQTFDNSKQKEVFVQGAIEGQTEFVSAYVRVKASDTADEKEVEVGGVAVQTYD